MERVNKGEKYWFISATSQFDSYIVMWRCDMRGVRDDKFFNGGNYFHTEEEAKAMVRKLRAVLKGADVIEMPNENAIENEALENNYIHKERGDCNYPDDLCVEIFKDGVEYFKSKIVK